MTEKNHNKDTNQDSQRKRFLREPGTFWDNSPQTVLFLYYIKAVLN